MASVNKVILVGNLGRDPEVRYSPDGGSAICSLSLATSLSWKDRYTGEKKEETEWHRVIFFGAIAEVCERYLKKGSSIYVEGRLRTRKWTDKDNIDRYTTEIVGEKMTMLGSRNSTGDVPLDDDFSAYGAGQYKKPAVQGATRAEMPRSSQPMNHPTSQPIGGQSFDNTGSSSQPIRTTTTPNQGGVDVGDDDIPF